MTRTQQLEQQPEQQQARGPATELNQETFGLPRPLYAQIMRLTPDDAEALASMLKTHQLLSGAILQVAARHMGNAAVQRAISITKAGSKDGPGEQPAHGPLSQAELHQFLDDPAARAQPAQGPLSHAEMHEFLDDPPAKAQPTETAAAPNAGPVGPKTATQADSPQMAAARAYNHQHSDLATQFNDLTNYMCIDAHGGGDEIEDGRKLDPKLVASWQQQHGLQADGMVGPLTVAKARAIAAKPSAVAAAPRADARPPV